MFFLDVANATQSLNASIANTILYMKQETHKIFSKVPSKLANCCEYEIAKEFSLADDLISNIMQPLVNSISEAIESIILTLHKEDYQGLVQTSQLLRYGQRKFQDFLKFRNSLIKTLNLHFEYSNAKKLFLWINFMGLKSAVQSQIHLSPKQQSRENSLLHKSRVLEITHSHSDIKRDNVTQ